MTNTLSVEPLSSQTWDDLASTFRDASYRQGSSYAVAAAVHVGATSELSGLMEDRRLIGLADVRVKKLPMTSLGVAYLNYAPMVRQDDRFCEERFGRCLDALREEYVDRRRLMLRITPALNGGRFQDAQVSCLEARGFVPNSRRSPHKTIVLDLENSLDDLHRGLHPKWRSDLKKSEGADIKVTRSTDLEDFDHFEDIFLRLTKEKGFMPSQDVRFFKHVQAATPQQQKLVFHLAWHGSELVAGHLGSFVGDTAVYLLGATTAKGRDLHASYLLQWSAITYGKAIGNAYYDLGGIDQEKNPDVYRFKQRLNGRVVTEIGPYELAPGPTSRRIIALVESARTMVRRRT